MEDPGSVERQIQAEVERLRAQFSDTQDLYRETCVLLFFRFGITPTANKLYQFVRKGSMSAPAEALAQFWANLREKSRVRIEHPDLPEELKDTAGQLAATLWSLAQTEARKSFAAFRVEAEEKIKELSVRLELADSRYSSLESELTQATESTTIAKQANQELSKQLAAEISKSNAYLEQIRLATDQNAVIQRSLDTARLDFSAELDKQRKALADAEERLDANEKRALLEIDRERTQVKRLEKDLEAHRSSATQAALQSGKEYSALQDQFGGLRQRFGVIEGQLAATTAQRNELITKVELLQGVVNAQASAIAVANAEVENWKRQTQLAEDRINLVSRQVRKPKSKKDPDQNASEMVKPNDESERQ